MNLRGLALASLLALPALPAAPAAADAPTNGEILQAVRRARIWIQKRQHRDGGWGPVTGTGAYGNTASHPAGPTALAVFALLAAGVVEKDPTVKRGFHHLRHTNKPRTPMEISATLLALTATAQPRKKQVQGPALRRIGAPGRYRTWAQQLTDPLIEGRAKQGWRYNAKPASPGGPEDLFATHLATCALTTLWRAGIKAKDQVWDDILAFTLAQQQVDGPPMPAPDPLALDKKRTPLARGFSYIRGGLGDDGRSTGAMTACGVSNLAMVRSVLTHFDLRADAKKWKQRTDVDRITKAMDDGVAWLQANWCVDRDPNGARLRASHIGWLWNLQCAMDALGRERLGDVNWFNEGARLLLNRQHPDGHWETQGTWKPRDLLDTCFAVLFLTRALRRWLQPF